MKTWGDDVPPPPSDPKLVRCVVCLQWKMPRELWVDENDHRWNICLTCHEQEIKVAAEQWLDDGGAPHNS